MHASTLRHAEFGIREFVKRVEVADIFLKCDRNSVASCGTFADIYYLYWQNFVILPFHELVT